MRILCCNGKKLVRQLGLYGMFFLACLLKVGLPRVNLVLYLKKKKDNKSKTKHDMSSCDSSAYDSSFINDSTPSVWSSSSSASNKPSSDSCPPIATTESEARQTMAAMSVGAVLKVVRNKQHVEEMKLLPKAPMASFGDCATMSTTTESEQDHAASAKAKKISKRNLRRKKHRLDAPPESSKQSKIRRESAKSSAAELKLPPKAPKTNSTTTESDNHTASAKKGSKQKLLHKKNRRGAQPQDPEKRKKIMFESAKSRPVEDVIIISDDDSAYGAQPTKSNNEKGEHQLKDNGGQKNWDEEESLQAKAEGVWVPLGGPFGIVEQEGLERELMKQWQSLYFAELKVACLQHLTIQIPRSLALFPSVGLPTFSFSPNN